MSEDRTKELKKEGSFEERIIARVDRMEIRITNLEHKEYDTKPIWERALAEIAETNRRISELTDEMRSGNEALRNDLRAEFQTANEVLRKDLRFEFLTVNEALRNDLRSEFQTGIEGVRTDLRSDFQSGIEDLRKEMKAEFAGVRHTLAHELRSVARKIDTLNHNFLEIQTEQRYLDRRLEELETK